MRYLFTLLLLALPAFGQGLTLRNTSWLGLVNSVSNAPTTNVTFRLVGSRGITTALLNYTNTSANTISSNTLALAFCTSSLASWAKPTNVLGFGMTWTEIASTNIGSAMGISVWRSMTNADTASGNISVQFAAAQTGGNVGVVEFGNVNTTGSQGSGAVVQFVMSTNAAATTGTMTLAALKAGGTNAVCAFFGNFLNVFTGTAEANWTEAIDIGYTTPSTGGYCEYRLGPGMTDNTASVDFSSSGYGGVAIEIQLKP